jgi:hypothetical protein
MILLTLALTASPVTELATILFCGTTDQPTPICCQAAREVRNQTDKRGRAIIDRYLAKNCDKEKRPPPVGDGCGPARPKIRRGSIAIPGGDPSPAPPIFYFRA